MIVFIDESGIHKKIQHSTFVLAYIESEHYQDLEEKIKEIEKKLKIDHFHWAKTVWKVKEKFMDQALKLDFQAKIAVIKNPVNPAKELERTLIHMIVERNIRTFRLRLKNLVCFSLREKPLI